MKLPIFLFTILSCLAQTSVTGTFKSVDGTAITGRTVVQLNRGTAIDTCAAGHTVAFKPVTTAITAGTLGSLSLIANECLSIGTASNAVLLPGTGAGIAPVIAITGKWYGDVTITTGTSTQANAVVAVIALKIPPGLLCTLNAVDTSTLASGTSYSVVSAKSISIKAGTAKLAESTLYRWHYSCVVPYSATVYKADKSLLYSGQWIVPQLPNIASFFLTVIAEVIMPAPSGDYAPLVLAGCGFFSFFDTSCLLSLPGWSYGSPFPKTTFVSGNLVPVPPTSVDVTAIDITHLQPAVSSGGAQSFTGSGYSVWFAAVQGVASPNQLDVYRVYEVYGTVTYTNGSTATLHPVSATIDGLSDAYNYVLDPGNAIDNDPNTYATIYRDSSGGKPAPWFPNLKVTF